MNILQMHAKGRKDGAVGLEKLNKEYSDKSPEDIVRFVVENIGIEKVALASSLSIEESSADGYIA